MPFAVRTLALLALVALSLAGCDDDEKKDQQANATPAPAAAPAPAPASAPSPEPMPAPGPAPGATPMPELTVATPELAAKGGLQQADLIALVEAGRQVLSTVDRGNKEALDVTAKAALSARNQGQCVMLFNSDLTATDWTGTVRGVFPMEDTLTLQVEFTKDAFVMTNFGPGLDPNLGKVTSFAKGSPLYDTVAALQPGDKVTFSGTFFADTADRGCMIVIPSTQPSEFIDYPTYFFEYTAVGKS